MELSCDPAIPLLGAEPKEGTAGASTDTWQPRYTDHYSQSLKGGGHPVSTGSWMGKRRVVRLPGGLLLSLEQEGGPDTATWMDLDDVMHSEMSQTQKDKLCDSTHMSYLEASNPQSQRVDGGARGWERGMRSEYLMRTEFHVEKTKRVLEMMVVTPAQQSICP